MPNNQQNLLDKVKEDVSKYSERENQKILQVFHITVLVIIALLTEKINDSPIIAYTLLFSFMFVSLSYFFFYLTDYCNTTVLAYSYVQASDPNKSNEEIQRTLTKYDNYADNCRNWCLFCTIASFILLFVSVFMLFNIKLVQCYYIAAFLIPIFILYKAINYYLQITKE